MSFRSFVLALGTALLLSVPASAHSVKIGNLEITDLWTRATPPGAPTAAGYMTISNNGSEDDTLLSAGSPDAASAQLHVMETKDGVMTMRPVDGGIAIPAGGKVTLAPDGLHIMFVTLKEPLKEGEKFPVTLTFAKAGKIDTFLHVQAIGASGMDMSGMGSMQHPAAP